MSAAPDDLPILKAHRETMALELRALSLWADIQNAAQFLCRQQLHQSLVFVLNGDDAALFDAYVKASRATVISYPAHQKDRTQDDAKVSFDLLTVTVLRTRPATAAELASLESGVAE